MPSLSNRGGSLLIGGVQGLERGRLSELDKINI